MKDRIREVTERTVAFNTNELEFLERLVNHARNELPANGVSQATKCLIDRVGSKLSRAQNYRITRRR
jgi:hypothetical protein